MSLAFEVTLTSPVRSIETVKCHMVLYGFVVSPCGLEFQKP